MIQGQVVFYMWQSFRQSLIHKHYFFLEQARKRLLSQFEDMETDSKRAAVEWLAKHSSGFNSDRDDAESYYESAYDAGIEHYELLNGMLDQTRLSVLAGLFHDWEKQLRDWMAKEVRHTYGSENAANKIWKANFSQIIDLMESYGWPIRNTQYFERIDECRCVVNVYKHGDGGSFVELKKKYPYYLVIPFAVIDPIFFDVDLLDYTNVKVSDSQLQEFSDAIVKFWEDVPERLYGRDGMEVPDWFGNAINTDQNTRLGNRSVPKN
ncbi:hypothetical protein [Pseudomonas sp. SDO5561_S422]